MATINKHGYWVSERKDGELRTYACASLDGLHEPDSPLDRT